MIFTANDQFYIVDLVKLLFSFFLFFLLFNFMLLLKVNKDEYNLEFSVERIR